MAPSSMSNTKARDRAKIVCVHCHTRKASRIYPGAPSETLILSQVRFNLQKQENGVCSNCERRGQQCQ